MPSYHDLHITTRNFPRTALFNLPYDLMITCTRVGGWELWQNNKLIAGEFDDEGLLLDVGGDVIVDSLSDGK